MTQVTKIRERLGNKLKNSAEGKKMAGSPKPAGSDTISKLIAQYGCGPIKFTGTEEALYERHLLFDNIVDASAGQPA